MYLGKPIPQNPRSDSKAQAKGKGILEGCKHGDGLSRHWTVAVDDVGHAHGWDGAEHGVADSDSGDCHVWVHLLLQAESPQQETDRSKEEGHNQTPEAIFGFEISAAALGDGGRNIVGHCSTKCAPD